MYFNQKNRPERSFCCFRSSFSILCSRQLHGWLLKSRFLSNAKLPRLWLHSPPRFCFMQSAVTLTRPQPYEAELLRTHETKTTLGFWIVDEASLYTGTQCFLLGTLIQCNYILGSVSYMVLAFNAICVSATSTSWLLPELSSGLCCIKTLVLSPVASAISNWYMILADHDLISFQLIPAKFRQEARKQLVFIKLIQQNQPLNHRFVL